MIFCALKVMAQNCRGVLRSKNRVVSPSGATFFVRLIVVQLAEHAVTHDIVTVLCISVLSIIGKFLRQTKRKASII